MTSEQLEFAIQALRRASYRWKYRNEAFKAARVEYGHYKCAMCESIVGRREIQLDHIEPVSNPATGWVDLEDFVTRLLAPLSGWQVLCKSCHYLKTMIENDERRQNAKNRKEA